MGFDYTKSIEQLRQMSLQDLIGIIAAHNEPTVVQHAKHIYEEKMRDEQRKYDAEQVELKFKKDRENIEYQHSLTKQTIADQIKVMKRATALTAAATLIAAIIGVVLGDMITRNKEQKPVQILLDQEQLEKLRTPKAFYQPEMKTKKKYSSMGNPPQK